MLGPFARQRNWNVVKEQIFIFNFCNFLFLVFLFIFLNSKLLILRPNLLSEGLGAEARILQMFKPTLKRNWSFYENFSYIQTTKLNGSKRIKKLLTDEARLKLKALQFHIDCKEILAFMFLLQSGMIWLSCIIWCRTNYMGNIMNSNLIF